MLPQKNRLTSRSDFVALKNEGRKYQSTSFSLIYKPNALESSRLGIIVSTKISPKATKRNAVKRKLRAVMAKILPLLSESLDLLILVKTQALETNTQELEKETKDLFKRLNLF